MRTSRFNFWKLTTLILLLLIIFVSWKYFQEYKKNLPYKKELKNLQVLAERSQRENLEFQRQILAQQDPLNQEKEKKDKFGEAFEDEKVIIVSDKLLKSIILPFLLK
jgi:uncharacterized protein YlxW (UPF0749 family)